MNREIPARVVARLLDGTWTDDDMGKVIDYLVAAHRDMRESLAHEKQMNKTLAESAAVRHDLLTRSLPWLRDASAMGFAYVIEKRNELARLLSEIESEVE